MAKLLYKTNCLANLSIKDTNFLYFPHFMNAKPALDIRIVLRPQKITTQQTEQSINICLIRFIDNGLITSASVFTSSIHKYILLYPTPQIIDKNVL